MAIGIVTAVLLVALVLLVTERISPDLTGLGIIVALALSGVLEPTDAVAGFANPAVVTVAAMFILSGGIIRTGAVGFVGEAVIRLGGGHHRRAFVLVLLIVATASAFINNTPIVVLFIPIVLAMSCTYDISPSKVLIPLSFASILGGTCTLIGTSTNIILSDLAVEHGLDELGMFELAPLGIPLAIVGIAYLCLAAPRLLPGHRAPTCESEDRKDRRYLAELVVPEGSPLVGENPFVVLAERSPSLEVFELVRGGRIVHQGEGGESAREGDIILTKGSPNDFLAILRDGSASLPQSVEGRRVARSGAENVVAELIIPPQSELVGQRLSETALFREPHLEVIAVRKRGLHYGEQKTRSLRVRIGTILLVQCSPERLDAIRSSPDYIVVDEVHREIVRKDRAWRALLVFVAVIGAATTGLASIMEAALAGAVAMVLTGCISLRDALRTVQASVLILIAGTLALGAAMEQTGAAELYANGVLRLIGSLPPEAILSAIILMTSLGSLILSNNATAVLFLPIALSTATSLGVDQRAFLVAVCIGASACFATPIGYQTNLLVYGPGGYKFADYMKIGLPLNAIVWILGSILIPILWPL